MKSKLEKRKDPPRPPKREKRAKGSASQLRLVERNQEALLLADGRPHVPGTNQQRPLGSTSWFGPH